MNQPNEAVQKIDAEIAEIRRQHRVASIHVGEGLLLQRDLASQMACLQKLRKEITGEDPPPQLFDGDGRAVEVSMGPAIPA